MPRTLNLLVLFFLLTAVPGCGVIDYFFVPMPEDTAQELYEAGQLAMEEKNYDDAAEYYTTLKDRYPFSPYTAEAELALGDAYFLGERYEAAATAYKEFESLHPRHEQIPYVLYQIGVSGYKQFSSIDKPQKNITEALEYFYRLRETYPGTEYAEAAKDYIVKCRRVLADHELFVADFYWKMDRYGPAYERYAYVVDNFQDLPKVMEYARAMAQEAYYEHQKEQAEAERASHHGSWKQWFDWL